MDDQSQPDETIRRLRDAIMRSRPDGVVGVYHAEIFARAAKAEYDAILQERVADPTAH